jgi:hypothetical protein
MTSSGALPSISLLHTTRIMRPEFCINSQDVVTDNAGTCEITQNTDNDMETSQFQCEAGMIGGMITNVENNRLYLLISGH